MAADMVGAGRAGGCTAARRDLPPEQVAELAKQRKRDANARHRARKKAMAGLEEAMARVQLDAEKLRGAELAAAHAAMAGLRDYQDEMLRVLQFASLTDSLDGEVALLEGQDFAALDAGRMAALLEAEQRRMMAAQGVQRQGSDGSDGSEAGDGASGPPSPLGGAAQGVQQAAAGELPSAAASACSGGTLDAGCGAAAGSNTASAAAASTAVGEGAAPSHSNKSQPGSATAAAAASAAHSTGGGADSGASAAGQSQFVSEWLTHLDGVARNWQASQVPEVRSTFVRVAATAFNFLSIPVITQRNREFTMQLQHLVQRWEACPGSRREIEGQIAGRISTRQALIRHLAEHKVPTLMELWAANCCPPPAPGTPSLDGRPTIHHVLVPIAQYLQANLGPEQMKELEAAWQRYQSSTGAARLQRASAAVQLQYAAALQSVSWQKQSTQPNGGCTSERAEAYTAMADSTGCLSTLAQSEMGALVDLQEALVRVLSPIQMARVFLTSFPYNPDMTQICTWLFAPAAAPAIQPPAAGSAPAASSEASQPGAPPSAAQPRRVPAPPPPATAVGAMDTLGLLPEDGADAFMDLLSDRELDFLIADLAGSCNDSGHLLAATSPRLP